MVVILYNIRSAHNVGSIFRTADAAGIEKIYLCGITPSPKDKYGFDRHQLTKVSLGAEKYVPWEYRKSTISLIKELKKEKYKIIALEQDKKSIPYYNFKINKKDAKVALLLGNEIKGINKKILNLCDKIIEIPMRKILVDHLGKKEIRKIHHKESLNVAVAFGIVVFHFFYSQEEKIKGLD